MHRSYRFRLQTNARHRAAFDAALGLSNDLYNAALEERISAWSKARKAITKFDQTKSLTQIRNTDPAIASYATVMLRRPLEQVDEAFKGFFRRVKLGQKAGFPRFRSLRRVRSFGFTESAGWSLSGPLLRMKGLPNVRVKAHRPLHGKLRKLTIKRDGRGRWFAIINVDLPSPFGPTGQGGLGLDLGVESLVTDSEGRRYGRLAPDRLLGHRRTAVERELAKKKRGSKRFSKAVKRLAVLRQREVDMRRTRHFQIASQIIDTGAQIIAVEKLNVVNLTRSAKGSVDTPGRNVSAKAGLNRSIKDAGMAQFIRILTDKAESAGRLIVAVNPKGTSQRCSSCGAMVQKKLSQRRHDCPCGLSIHRDHNAALNVLQRGVVAPCHSTL